MRQDPAHDDRCPSLKALTLVLVAACLLLGGIALSAPITYSFRGTVSGTIGGSPFQNEAVTLIAVGDSAKVGHSATASCNPVSSLTLVSGDTLVTVNGNLAVFDNLVYRNAGIWVGGCGSATGYDWFRVNNPVLKGYNLEVPIGPLTVAATYADTTHSMDTSAGPLLLTGQSLTTFKAQVGACTPNATTLCLFDRFQVRAQYDTYGSSTFVDATATRFSDSTGFFTTVMAGDVDVVVKLVDFCSMNDTWSAYIGGTTDLGVQITITDTANPTHVYTTGNSLGTAWTLIRQVAFSCP